MGGSCKGCFRGLDPHLQISIPEIIIDPGDYQPYRSLSETGELKGPKIRADDFKQLTSKQESLHTFTSNFEMDDAALLTTPSKSLQQITSIKPQQQQIVSQIAFHQSLSFANIQLIRMNPLRLEGSSPRFSNNFPISLASSQSQNDFDQFGKKGILKNKKVKKRRKTLSTAPLQNLKSVRFETENCP